jgi:hypothetical protein
MEDQFKMEDIMRTDLAEPLDPKSGLPFVRCPAPKSGGGKTRPCDSCGTPTRMNSLCAVCSVESRLIALGCDISHGLRHLKGQDIEGVAAPRPRGRAKALKP